LTRISNVRKTTKFKRSIKAISPVIATLLMIAIAVVASLVVYAWVSGYIGGSTSKAGNSIQIQSFASSSGNLVVYVQNVGQGAVTLSPDQSIYVNGDLVKITNQGTDRITIPEGQTVELLTDSAYSGEKVNIKVTTTSGTFTQSTGTGSGSSVGTNLPKYTLTVNSAAHGSVAKTPDLAQYTSGSSVMLTATAADGYSFQSWSGDVPASDINSNPVSITMDANKVVTPNFVASPETLTILTPGTGAGSVTADPLPPYSYGAVVTLTAETDVSSTFDGWSGAGTTGTDPSVRTVTLNSDQTVIATFNIKTFTITASVTGSGGSISPTGAQTVNYDATPKFTVTANTGYHVNQVTVDSTTVTLDANGQYTFPPVQASHTIVATFAADTPTTAALTITFAGTGTGKVNDGAEDKTATFTKQYAYGSTVTLTPTANSGSTFTSWSGAGTGTTNRAIVMNGAQSATVTFTAISPHYVDANTRIHLTTMYGTVGTFASMQTQNGYATLTETDTLSTTDTMGNNYNNGQNSVTISANQMAGQAFVAGGSGSIPSVTFRAASTSSYTDRSVKIVITDSSGTILANGISQVITVDDTSTERTVDFTTDPVIQNGQTYWIMIIPNGDLSVRYYQTTGGISKSDATNSYTTPTNPTDATTGTTNYRILYANVNYDNYRLDQEFQFTTVTNYASYTKLQIQTTAFSDSEALSVQYWNGASWTILGNLQANQLNEFTVSLTSNAYHIRIVDLTNTNDATSSNWQINFARLA
jgi:flagellin-like protein